MTAFAEGLAESRALRVRVEVRSVNNRHADLRLRLPPGLASLESPLRRRVQAVVRRGRVDLTLGLEVREGADPQVSLNRSLVESVRAAAEVLRDEYGIEGRLDVNAVLSLPGALQGRTGGGEVSAEVEELCRRAVDFALGALDAERQREGAALASDLRARLERALSLLERIGGLAGQVPARARDKLVQRIEALTGGLDLDASRIAQEAAILADRGDVTEEVVRLRSHLEAMRSLLDRPDEQGVGKRLDFLLQEVHRETNTLTSKSGDLELSRFALEIKAETEKMREQTQNLE